MARSSLRRLSSTSLDSSSRSFARWPPTCFRSTWSARGISPAPSAQFASVSLRALAGYFGRAVGALRRSADHVDATAFVWHELIGLLDRARRLDLGQLHEWLAGPAQPIGRRRRIWPMPRPVRLSLPAAPGILYRMLRTDGSILNIGKAGSLIIGSTATFGSRPACPSGCSRCCRRHARSWFEVTPSPLEAALLEPDEIKPAPTALQRRADAASRAIVVDVASHRARRRTAAIATLPVGTICVSRNADQFAALARAGRAALAPGPRGPDDRTFTAGYDRLFAAHPELSARRLSGDVKLLRLGTTPVARGSTPRPRPRCERCRRDVQRNVSRRGAPVLGARSSCKCRWSGSRCARRSPAAARSG